MSRIDGNVTELSPRIGASIQTLQAAPCWVCQSNLSARAAFCHECGTIQAPRGLDHFTRMGIDRRFDIEREQLEGRFEAMQRIFQSERLARQRPAPEAAGRLIKCLPLTEAYHTLRDPVTRAQYLLSLVDDAGATVLDRSQQQRP
jgi:molecular chaperone HscB